MSSPPALVLSIEELVRLTELDEDEERVFLEDLAASLLPEVNKIVKKSKKKKTPTRPDALKVKHFRG